MDKLLEKKIDKIIDKSLQELWPSKNADVSKEVSAIEIPHHDSVKNNSVHLGGILYIVHEDFKGKCFLSEILEKNRTVLIFSEKEISDKQAEDAAHKIYGDEK